MFKLIIITTYFVCVDCEPKVDYGYATFNTLKQCNQESRGQTFQHRELHDGTKYSQISYCKKEVQ